MFLTPIRAICLTMCGLSLGGLMLEASRRDEQAGRSAAASSRARSYEGWTHYGGSPDQTRYSSLRQIDKSNVSRLTVAWTYDSGETGGLQTQPIVVDDVLYGYTPTHKTFALRADTGERLWTFDPKIEGRGPNRGLMYWSSGDDRRVFAAVDQYLYALDARTGQPIPAVRRRTAASISGQGLGRDPQTQSIRLTSPGVIFKDHADRRRARQRRPAGVARRYSRVRRPDRRAAVGVPHHSASRRDRLRDVVEGLVDDQRRRQQLAGHGARRAPRHRLRADRICGG